MLKLFHQFLIPTFIFKSFSIWNAKKSFFQYKENEIVRTIGDTQMFQVHLWEPTPLSIVLKIMILCPVLTNQKKREELGWFLQLYEKTKTNGSHKSVRTNCHWIKKIPIAAKWQSISMEKEILVIQRVHSTTNWQTLSIMWSKSQQWKLLL